MIASLPMYLRPENRAAHDRYYSLIRDALRDHGVATPEGLSHDAPIWQTWGRADLVLGQICNLPYRTQFAPSVTLIGSADHGLPDTAPGTYYSVFVTRLGDDTDPASYADRPLAYNEALSQSGWGAPWLWARDRGFAWTNTTATGAHFDSARAVAEGRADIAALDAQSWRNITRWEPCAPQLQVIGRTQSSPGQSYITAPDQDPAPFRAALPQAMAALSDADRGLLDLHGLVTHPDTAYSELPNPTPPPS